MISPVSFSFNYNTNPIAQKPIVQLPKLAFNKVSQPVISFTGKTEDLLRTIGNVSCPCCGVKMLTKEGFDKISKELSGRNCAQNYVKVLNNYEEYMHKPEKEVFHRFRDWASDKPKEKLETFMQESRESSLENCKLQKTEKINKLNQMVSDIDAELGAEFVKMTAAYEKSPYNTEDDMKDVRKWVISDVENLENKIEDKTKFKSLMKEAQSLPTSKNNADAFIVKYASSDSLKVGKRLLKLSVGTIEHIKPQAKGGKDKLDNYLLECGECNHTRGEIPLDDWVEDHPEMKVNIQKYFDEIIEKINSGNLKGLENYPNTVKGAIMAQSKGTLTYDTSALKPQTGKRLNIAA